MLENEIKLLNVKEKNMEMNPEVIINKLEYKLNELTIRSAKLEKLGTIKDKIEATYRCELRKDCYSYHLIIQMQEVMGKLHSLDLIET